MLNSVTASIRKGVALLALCACSMAQAQQAPSRIGFVFTERLMTESKLAKAADARIENEFSKRDKVNMELLARLKSLSDKFDTEAPKMGEAERTKRARELLDMEKEVQRAQREFREDLMQRKSEERAIIAQKAYKIIEQIAEQEKLDIVLQESAWSSPRIDITEKILKILDK
jgi:outer membrane protein